MSIELVSDLKKIIVLTEESLFRGFRLDVIKESLVVDIDVGDLYENPTRNVIRRGWLVVTDAFDVFVKIESNNDNGNWVQEGSDSWLSVEDSQFPNGNPAIKVCFGAYGSSEYLVVKGRSVFLVVTKTAVDIDDLSADGFDYFPFGHQRTDLATEVELLDFVLKSNLV